MDLDDLPDRVRLRCPACDLETTVDREESHDRIRQHDRERHNGRRHAGLKVRTDGGFDFQLHPADVATDGGQLMDGKDSVKEVLEAEFPDRIYTVEEDVVWVSGMNANCGSVARRMAKTLSHGHDIPTGLVYDDDAVRFGGVQFNWGEAA